MSSLPTCALEDCQQRPEVYVWSKEWGFPRVKKLCQEHADWARGADGFHVGEKRQTKMDFLQEAPI